MRGYIRLGGSKIGGRTRKGFFWPELKPGTVLHDHPKNGSKSGLRTPSRCGFSAGATLSAFDKTVYSRASFLVKSAWSRQKPLAINHPCGTGTISLVCGGRPVSDPAPFSPELFRAKSRKMTEIFSPAQKAPETVYGRASGLFRGLKSPPNPCGTLLFWGFGHPNSRVGVERSRWLNFPSFLWFFRKWR